MFGQLDKLGVQAPDIAELGCSEFGEVGLRKSAWQTGISTTQTGTYVHVEP